MTDMTIDRFMQGIKENVRKAAIDATIMQLTEPTGRKPRVKHVEQSKWFHQLSASDREMLAAVMKESVDEALFGLFAVLDGVRDLDDLDDLSDIEDENDIDNVDFGHYELFYVKDGVRTLLNEAGSMDLHDEYNAITIDCD